jgi:hypothetical protein
LFIPVLLGTTCKRRVGPLQQGPAIRARFVSDQGYDARRAGEDGARARERQLYLPHRLVTGEQIGMARLELRATPTTKSRQPAR